MMFFFICYQFIYVYNKLILIFFRLAAQQLLSQGLLPRYSMATTPQTTYQVHQSAGAAGWVHPSGYIVQPPMAHVSPFSYYSGQAQGLIDPSN